MIQKLHKTFGGWQIQYIDKVVRDVQVPMIHKLHMILEGLQTQYIDKVVRGVHVPMSCSRLSPACRLSTSTICFATFRCQ